LLRSNLAATIEGSSGETLGSRSADCSRIAPIRRRCAGGREPPRHRGIRGCTRWNEPRRRGLQTTGAGARRAMKVNLRTQRCVCTVA